MEVLKRLFERRGSLVPPELAVAAFFAVTAPGSALAAENAMELLEKTQSLVGQERYADAEATARKACKEFERRAQDLPALLGECYFYLGAILVRQERQQEALAYLETSLKAFEGFLGKDTSDIAPVLTSLADTYMDMGRPSVAGILYARALAIYRASGSNDEIARVQFELGKAYAGQGRIDEAEKTFGFALAMAETAFGKDDKRLAYILDGIGHAFREQGRYAKAESRFREALAIRERTLPAGDPDFALSFTFLGLLSESIGQIERAIDFNKQALSIREQALGEEHPLVAANLSNLGNLYRVQGRFSMAESYLRRVVAVAEAQGKSGFTAISINNLAVLYSDQGNFEEARKLYERALSINEKALGSESEYVSISLNNIASLYQQQGRLEDAVPLYERSLAIQAGRLGLDNPESLGVQVNLGALYQAQKRYAEAEEMLTRVATVREGVFGANHPETLRALSLLASLFAVQSRFAEALPLVQRTIGSDEIDAELSISVLREAERRKMLPAEVAFAQSYEIVQSTTGTSAALAVQKLAARYAGGSSELARDIRRDQDLMAEAQALDNALSEQLGRAASERNAREEKRLRRRLDEISLERKELLRLIQERHPQYSALMQPQPLTLAETQALLGEDEAVVILAVGAEKSFVWAVTRDSHTWADMQLPGTAVDEKVQRLRQSLTFERDAPFDTVLAYELYRDLLGPISGEIVGKRRLSVLTTGALTSLPLQLLVTTDPAGTSLKDVDWLVKSHAVTLVPSVFSLKTMRAIAGRSAAPRPMIAFADPVFHPSAGRAAGMDKLASRSLASFYEGSELDVEGLSEALPQLPGTRREVLAIARALGADPADVKLGEEATVTAVKAAQLEDYRIAYFATHALVAGDLERFTKAKAEPALVLSIPEMPSAEDSGLLSASDVAELKLDADWVVLSACNTAAGEGPGAEALSGLAQAFLYSGARSLVVSNWDVSDDITANLMARLFEVSSQAPSMSHGEALRQAELSLIAEAATDEQAHPRNWAPFIIVGEPAPDAGR